MTRQGHGTGRRRQRGLGLPTAIFVITVMVSLAAGIHQLVTRNAEATSESIQLTRAQFAAESGAGFAMNARFPPAEYPDYAVTAICPDNSASPRVYELEVAGLRGCQAQVSCTVEPFTAVPAAQYFTIRSTGTCGKVSQTIEVRSRFEP